MIALVLLVLAGAVGIGSLVEWLRSRDEQRAVDRYARESHRRLMAELREK